MLIECDVHYDAEADRLVGADFDREFDGRWARSTIVPWTRVDRLWTRLTCLDRTYREDRPTLAPDAPVPFPRPMATITPNGLPGTVDGSPQILPLDMAFSGTALRSSPPEFRAVAQVVCMIDDPTTLADRRPDTTEAWSRFATTLFAVLHHVHRGLHLALTKGCGSSIGQTGVSTAGHLLDPYYLVGPGDLPGADLYRGQRDDLARALGLLAAAGEPALHSIVPGALSAYRGYGPGAPHPSASAVGERVVRGVAAGDIGPGLAEAVLTDGR